MKKHILLFVLLFYGALSSAYAGNISVKLSSSSVGLYDTFTVVFTADHIIKGQPDFSPLTTDFDVVVGPNMGLQIINNNGVVTQSPSWSFVLKGKKEGKYEIPSIQFGSLISPPQSVEIVKSSPLKKDDELFVEVELSPSAALYEQSLLIYTIKIFYAVRISQGILSDLKVNDPDAIIERLGTDTQYERLHTNGRRYGVLERKYTVIPQHTGELVFAPVIFEASIMGANSFFDFNQQTKRAYSTEEKVDVKPIPASFQKNNWFPANSVTLSEDWSADPLKMLVGEPITWTITVKAEGCMGTQIPDIKLTLPHELKHYEDKPQANNQVTANSVYGEKQIKIALIANKSGEFIVPELSIPWWDLKTEQVRHAIIPSKTLHVQASHVALSDSQDVKKEVEEGTSQVNAINTQESSLAHVNDNHKPIHSDLPIWVWIMIGANSLLLVAAGVYVFIRLNTNKSKVDCKKPIKNQLQAACFANDAKQVERLLIEKFPQQYPQKSFVNLMDIKLYLADDMNGADLMSAITRLHHALYSVPNKWDGIQFWKVYVAYKPQKVANPKAKIGLLKELYPEG